MSENIKLTRWVATIAGLIGFVLSVATPLLPVVQTTATLNWPQSGQLNDVTAPLISETPVSMTATVPCDVIRSMPPSGGMVLSTAPKGGKQATLKDRPCDNEWQLCVARDFNPTGTSPRGCVCMMEGGQLSWTCGATNRWWRAE